MARPYDEIHALTFRAFWFAADTVRQEANLPTLGSSDARELYCVYRDRAVREELRGGN
jgi:hypothetical protein